MGTGVVCSQAEEASQAQDREVVKATCAGKFQRTHDQEVASILFLYMFTKHSLCNCLRAANTIGLNRHVVLLLAKLHVRFVLISRLFT